MLCPVISTFPVESIAVSIFISLTAEIFTLSVSEGVTITEGGVYDT